jgi:hypothetical protein
MSNFIATSNHVWALHHHMPVSKSDQSNPSCNTQNAGNDVTVKIEHYITKAKTFKQADQLLFDLQELKEITKGLQGVSTTQTLLWITK